MIIEAVDIYRVRMPLVYPFRTAFGDTSAVESVLVRLVGGGHEGWGETAPWQAPSYSPEWAAGVFCLLNDWLTPRILGHNITSGAHLAAELCPIRGNPFAKAALDLAWWDLHARILGQPLWQVLGGAGDEVEVGADFGVMESVDALLETISAAVDDGFRRVKLKYRPGWELNMLQPVRAAFPNMVFHVDCNSAYSLADVAMLRSLDDYQLAMIEQPLAYDDLHDHAVLQRQLATPICLDESVTSLARASQAIEMGACGWLNIKPGRVGGLTSALEIHNLCQSAGVPVWIGGMLESGVGAMHCLALATLPNVRYPSDVFPSARFYGQDMCEPEVVVSRPAHIRAAPGPGIGCAPNEQRLRTLTIEEAHFHAG